MTLDKTDPLVIIPFFLSMVSIGVWSYFRSRSSEDYFVASGKLPWWLAGILVTINYIMEVKKLCSAGEQS